MGMLDQVLCLVQDKAVHTWGPTPLSFKALAIPSSCLWAGNALLIVSILWRPFKPYWFLNALLLTVEMAASNYHYVIIPQITAAEFWS